MGTLLFPGNLIAWLERIKELKNSFSTIHFSHIFREKNSQANRLSKKGLSCIFGEMHCVLSDALGAGAIGKVKFF